MNLPTTRRRPPSSLRRCSLARRPRVRSGSQLLLRSVEHPRRPSASSRARPRGRGRKTFSDPQERKKGHCYMFFCVCDCATPFLLWVCGHSKSVSRSSLGCVSGLGGLGMALSILSRLHKAGGAQEEPVDSPWCRKVSSSENDLPQVLRVAFSSSSLYSSECASAPSMRDTASFRISASFLRTE